MEDTTRHIAFRTASIIRFHGYAGGFQWGVYELLLVSALPPDAVTVADLIRAAVRTLRHDQSRAFLNVLLNNVNAPTLHGIGTLGFLRICRYSVHNGRRDRIGVLLSSLIVNSIFNGNFTVVFRAD